MKKIFMLLVSCVVMVFVSCSNDDDNNDENVGTVLVGTWRVSKYFYECKENGKVTDTEEYGEEKNETFVLKKDGSSDFNCSISQSCTWKYQEEKLHFHWSNKDGETDDMVYNIMEFSNNNLIMEWKNSEGNEEVYEKYELKKIDKATEEPDDSSDDDNILPKEYERINLKFGEKHYFIGGGGGHYIKFGSRNRFYIGYDAFEKQYSALIDMGKIAANAYPSEKPDYEKPDYISAMNNSMIPVKIHHGYYYYIIYESLEANPPIYFWVEDYIKTNGTNIDGISIIRH